MADRDAWEKAESFSKIFAALVIPIVLGFASFYASQTLEKSKTRDELLKQAIDVVFLSKSDQMAGADKSFESRRAHRSHWLEIYNNLSDVKLSDAFIAVMMEQDARVVEGMELYTVENKPAPIPNNERAESTNEDELGHGWVAVGRLKSERYSDTNFTLPPNATNPDDTIKPHTIMRARWSVSLRKNSRNLEDRQGYAGTSRGLMGRRVRQGDRLAGRWASPNLGLHRNRAVPHEIGSWFRAPSHVRRAFVDPVKTPISATKL